MDRFLQEISEEDGVFKFYNAQETQLLFRVVKNDTSKYHLRNLAILHVAKYCALRVSEVGIIRTSDLNLRNPFAPLIYCKRLKRGRNNTLKILDPNVIVALNQYLDVRSELFPKHHHLPFLFLSRNGRPIDRRTLDNIIRTYAAKAGLPSEKRHFHVLRHTRALELAEDLQLDLKDIQFWLGHRNVQNTQRYLEYTTRQQEHIYQRMASFYQSDYPIVQGYK